MDQRQRRAGQPLRCFRWKWSGAGNGGNGPEVFEKDQYYYHPDHLGSSSYITDLDGDIFQHLEYFPFGETWVEEHSNTQRTPWLFTGKELDEETGLYYFGARYYDPRTSVWQSPDPILTKYMSGSGNAGIYNSMNLGLYSYSYANPVNLVDPDGNEVTQDAVITWSNMVDNVRTWETNSFGENSSISLSDRLVSFRDAVHSNTNFEGTNADTSSLGWHYFFTSEGWIDMGHFSNAARFSNVIGEGATKFFGDAVEGGQFLSAHIPGYNKGTQTSAFTREDYRSNRLGAEFATFLETYEGDSLADAFESFVGAYGPSESPRSAPDFNDLPRTQTELDSRGYFESLGDAYGNMWNNGMSGDGVGTVFTRSKAAE